MRRRSLLWTSRVAAFVAAALLMFAGVKSPVMQAQMALGVSDCGMTAAEMAGGQMQADPFAPAPEKAAPAKPMKASSDVCAFCADAAHAPLIACVEPIRPPAAVRFVPRAPRPPLGARAPPLVETRARGPPSPLLTA